MTDTNNTVLTDRPTTAMLVAAEQFHRTEYVYDEFRPLNLYAGIYHAMRAAAPRIQPAASEAGAVPVVCYPGWPDWITSAHEEVIFLAGWNAYGDALRSAPPSAPPAQPEKRAPVELAGIAEIMAEGDGFWRSCTGCHELNEGHDTGPYSEILKCHLGNGCAECGGIGAIWDTTDYQAMADALAAPPAPSQQAAPAAESAEPNGHIDDDAVDHFAAAMKEKLAQARAKGRHGWHECPPADLSRMLREHVEKGDPRDVANFCMFLWSLGHPITAATADAQGNIAASVSDKSGCLSHSEESDRQADAQGDERAALQTLVDLEDMRLRLHDLHERGHGTDYDDYHKALPKAWDAARAALSRQPSAAASAGDVDADRYRWLFDVRTEEEANDYNVGLAPDKPQDIVLAQLACRYFHKALADALIDEARAALATGKPEGTNHE